MFCDCFEDFSPVLNHCFSVIPLLHETDSYPPRIVERYEFEYVFAVTGTPYVMTEGTKLPLKPETLYFRRPGMPVQGAGIYNSYFFDFDFNMRKEMPDSLNAMPYSYELPDPQKARQLIEAIFDDYYKDVPTRTLQFKVYMGELFRMMVDDWYYHTKPAILKTIKTEDFRHSVSYINEHYAEPLTVSALAGKAGYSIYHYTRLFRQYTGFSPVQYINHCRVAQAKKMLAQTAFPVDVILYDCGFHNYSYFFRTFKALSGMTPGEYRKRTIL